MCHSSFMCHGVQKRLSGRIFGPSKSFCRLFLWKKQQQKSKVQKNALILDLLQHANIPSASSAVGQPRNQPREHAIKEMLCCWQTSKVRCQELLLDTADETFSPTFVDFFSFWVTPETSTEAKGMSFQSSCQFFFWGWDMIYFHYI